MPKQYNAAGYVADPEGWYSPVLASGVAHTATDTNTTITVVPGERYLVHNIDASYSAYIGFATQATAANRLWVVNPGEKAGINIPANVTTLNFLRTAANNCSLHLVQVEG